ncbi:MAG: hypothetical protein K2I56_00275, partial [Muribaculaceae bacterium]|nr:hypothetical protein [Muribaculaceae bacterium]
YADFEKIMSSKRMERYLTACGGDTRKAMTLYRYNLQISQEMFTIVSCFEVALRNAIDRCMFESVGIIFDGAVLIRLQMLVCGLSQDKLHISLLKHLFRS